MASSNNHFLNRQAFKAAKELEEARKAGTAPPAVDADGKSINPHIPEYISQAPWYIADEGPSLKHQDNHNAKKRNFDSIDKWLPRAQFASAVATKFRKGACTNCGAITHAASQCLERPRRRGAKLTGSDIRPDEVIDSVNLDFEGKRDRWNGYDAAINFKQVHVRYEKLDAARKALKAQRLDSAMRAKPSRNSAGADDRQNHDIDDDDDEPNGALADGAVVQETGDAAKTAVRNLRIREDTAKYLYNLDLNSAYYDPKSRSMRADPRPDVDPNDKDFIGDNFVRHSDDVAKLSRLQLHDMGAQQAGRQFPHLQAEPSRAEAVFKQFESKKSNLQHKRDKKILDKYGGQDYVRPEAAIEGVEQTEEYVEYNSEGKVVNGGKMAMPVSKYAEDVLEKNHTAVWGSYYKDGQWGYTCCFQTQRYAVCTGENGKRAAIETERDMKQRTAAANAKRGSTPLTEGWERAEKERREGKRQDESERERTQRGPGYDHVLSERDMEEYRLKQHEQEDPMAKFLNKDIKSKVPL